MKALKVKTGMVVPCDACKGAHIFEVPRWNYNGDAEKPTFSPSMKVSYPNDWPRKYCCHFNITDGQIIYHGDCTHEMAGKTIPLRDFTEEEVNRYNQPGYQE